MPLTHIALRSGKPAAYRQAILDGVHRALQEALQLPDENEFAFITEHDAANFRYGKSYLGIARSDDMVYIQVTINNTRPREQKLALYRRLVHALGEHPGVRPEDVFVSVVDVPKENWSLGSGVAQYLEG